MTTRELLIGCGISRAKRLALTGTPQDWTALTTLDHYAECEPDVIWNLEKLPYPFDDESFDEIHAYCVLEHTGAQGDWKFFFDQWSEFWRIMRPNGLFYFIAPRFDSPWAWGDPSHKRIIGREQITYLNQAEYERQLPAATMTDFRWYYKRNFALIHYDEKVLPGFGAYVLQKQDVGEVLK